MAANVILIEASPRRAADGVAQTVRLAGGGALYPYRYGGNDWRAGVVQLPTFVTSITFEGGDFGAGGVPSAAELQWAASAKPDLAAVADLYWIDAPVTVRIGPENDTGALPPIALSGKALSALVDGGVLKIGMSDPAADLKKPLLTDRYGGTGDLDGPAEWDGKIKPRVWGRVWNRAGECIDKANNIWCWADPLRPIQSFDALRDKGANAAALDVLAWQGSAAATLAALRAAVAPQGGGVACPSIACVKWWTQPAGDLTADLHGEIGAGYVETTADIVARIVAAGPGTAFAAGTVATARAARPAPVGWVAADDSTTVAAMIEELLGNSSLLWLLNDTGEIVLREWAWGAPAAYGVSQSVKRTATYRPVATRKLGYRRNEKVMARGDLAAIVLVQDVLFPDGTPIADSVSAAYALAASRGKVWATPTVPAVADSAPGDTWIDPVTGTFYERVGAGGLLLGDHVIELGGYLPYVAWRAWVAQPLAPVVTTSADALAKALAALNALATLADDGIISGSEKTETLIPRAADLAAQWAVLSSQATSFGVSTAAAALARTAWLTFLTGLAPAWNDVSQDTPVDRATFDAQRSAYVGALYDLDQAIKAKVSTLAVWANVSGAGKPQDNATVGAPAGTNVGGTDAATVEAGANAGNAGLNADGTVKTGKVDTLAVVSGAISATTIVSASGSGASFATIHELAYIAVPTLPAGVVGVEIAAYGQIKYTGSAVPGYPVLRLYRVAAANASAYIASGSGTARNPSSAGVPTGKNWTLPNWSNVDEAGAPRHSTVTPAAGDLYVLGIDVGAYPPGAGAWSCNWSAEIALNVIKR